jgi:hypothetical protein
MANITLDKAGGKSAYKHAHPHSFGCPEDIRDYGTIHQKDAAAQADSNKT